MKIRIYYPVLTEKQLLSILAVMIALKKKELTDFIKINKLNPIAIINTHCHIDHVLGNDYLKKLYEIPLWIPATEKELLKSVSTYAPTMGIQGYKEAQPDIMLKEKDLIKFGSEKLEILYAPGHSEGHLMFYHAADQILIAGEFFVKALVGRIYQEVILKPRKKASKIKFINCQIPSKFIRSWPLYNCRS